MPGGTGIEVDAGCLIDAQKATIKAHKPELIVCIQKTARITSELMATAMRACDYWHDSPKAREQMRLEILETRPERREELLRMFKADGTWSAKRICWRRIETRHISARF